MDVAGFRTIGFGHRLRPDESYPDGITSCHGDAILVADVAIAEAAVYSQVRVPLSQGQFDALWISSSTYAPAGWLRPRCSGISTPANMTQLPGSCSPGTTPEIAKSPASKPAAKPNSASGLPLIQSKQPPSSGSESPGFV